ncbi:MAG: hypothetical protein ACAI44_36870 [Candidatus Sericytochromatia bacterium]
MVIQPPFRGTAPLQPGHVVEPAKPQSGKPQAPGPRPEPLAQQGESLQVSSQGRSSPQMDFIGDSFAEAYGRLNPAQKSQFDGLLQQSAKMPAFMAPAKPQTLGPVYQGNPADPFQGQGFGLVDVPFLNSTDQQTLRNLLSDGTLLRKASDGQTVLEHLAALVRDDHNDKTNGPVLARDLIRMLQPEDLNALKQQANHMSYHLNDKGQRKQDGIPMPGGLGEITQCPVHYTCGAASMQVWMRLNVPEELVRITHDLVSKGEAGIPGGSLRPARTSLDYHAGDKIFDNELWLTKAGNEDRSDLDIILQSALMDKIAIGNLSPYDVDADSGGIFNVIDGNSGGHPLYLKRTMEKLTGKAFSYAHNLDIYSLGAAGRFLGNLSDRTPQADLVNQLKNQVQAGKQVMIAYQTKPSDPMALHFVTVVGYDAGSDKFYYADTDEKKTDRAKMYTKSSQDMQDVLRCVVYR